MIYDGIARFARRHPVAARGAVTLFFFVLIAYGILVWLSDSLVEDSRGTCGRGNETRLAEYREKQKLIAGELRKETVEEALGEKEKAEGSKEIIEAYEGKQEALVKIAENSGNQMTEDAVTINCILEYPKPLNFTE